MSVFTNSPHFMSLKIQGSIHLDTRLAFPLLLRPRSADFEEFKMLLVHCSKVSWQSEAEKCGTVFEMFQHDRQGWCNREAGRDSMKRALSVFSLSQWEGGEEEEEEEEVLRRKTDEGRKKKRKRDSSPRIHWSWLWEDGTRGFTEEERRRGSH